MKTASTIIQFKQALEAASFQAIDVRSPSEFNEEHLTGVPNLPVESLRPECIKGLLDPSKPVFILCQSGARGVVAADRLAAAGFADCRVVEGGLNAWKAAGFETFKGVSGPALPLMRQVQLAIGVFNLVGAALALSVDYRFALVNLFIGLGLMMAGTTGLCPLAMLIARMPWNRAPGKGSCGCGPKSCSL